MDDREPRMRIQAIRASETLYKAGDKSFAGDYKRMAQDPSADVVDSGDADDEQVEGRRTRAARSSRHSRRQQGARRSARGDDDPQPAGGAVAVADRAAAGGPSLHARTAGCDRSAAVRFTRSCASRAMATTASAHRGRAIRQA